MLHKFYLKIKAYPTFKIYCNIAFVAEALVAIVVLKGWRAGLSDAPAIMQDDAIAFGCTIIAYTLKAGFEHSKFATPQQAMMQQIIDHPTATAALSGLISSGGDLSVMAANAINAAQMAAEQQKEQQMENYADPSTAPPPTDMPADDNNNIVNNNMAG